ncbi:hypothetical protein HK101_005691, partial [Irineochytrium annulatum]
MIPDLQVNVIVQLDPADRSERQALISCLTVSRFLFQLAAARLWSTRTLFALRDDVTKIDEEPIKLPSRDRIDEAGSVAWRYAIYMASVRTLHVFDHTSSPKNVLPWLQRLDHLAVGQLNELWRLALIHLFSSATPSALTVMTEPGAESFVAFPRIKSLVIQYTSTDTAPVDLIISKISHDLELLRLVAKDVHSWVGTDQDIAALEKYFGSYGTSTRFELHCSHNVLNFAELGPDSAIPSRLVSLKLAINFHERLPAKLLFASRLTLRNLELEVYKDAYLFPNVLACLENLQS